MLFFCLFVCLICLMLSASKQEYAQHITLEFSWSHESDCRSKGVAEEGRVLGVPGGGSCTWCLWRGDVLVVSGGGMSLVVFLFVFSLSFVFLFIFYFFFIFCDFEVEAH